MRPIQSRIECHLQCTGVRYHGVDILPLLFLELQCLLLSPDSRYFSDAYLNFFEDYGVLEKDEQVFVDLCKDYMQRFVLHAWGEADRTKEYRWGVRGQSALFVEPLEPLRIRVANRKLKRNSCENYLANPLPAQKNEGLGGARGDFHDDEGWSGDFGISGESEEGYGDRAGGGLDF